MKQSKEILNKAGIVPALRLMVKDQKGVPVSTGPHRVKMLSDKPSKDIDPQTGKERYVMIYYVEENGEKKMYKAKMHDKAGNVHYLVQRLAEVEEGEEIILESKRNGAKNYIQVLRTSDPSSVEMEDEEDIPVINADEEIEADNRESGADADISL